MTWTLTAILIRWILPGLHSIGSRQAVAAAQEPISCSAGPAVDGTPMLAAVVVASGLWLGARPRRTAGAARSAQLVLRERQEAIQEQIAAEREAKGDPRPSIEERYASKDDYLERVRAAGEGLMAERYLLAEDIDVSVAQASKYWDWLDLSWSIE